MLRVIKAVEITAATFELLDLLTFSTDLHLSCGIYVKFCLVVSSMV